jgi:peptidyl-dipeptidase Dcp
MVTATALTVIACGDANEVTSGATSENGPDIVVSDAELAGNPFLIEWTTPYGVPPFAAIDDGHYMPAFKKGVLDRRVDVDAIADNPDAPTFQNTIVALETAGPLFNKVIYTFVNVRSTEMNDALRAIESDLMAMYTRETDATNLNEALYARVQAVYESMGTLGLSEEDARLLELTHRGFVRAGAALDPEVRNQVADINARISELNTKFAQNLLLATKAFTLEITDEAELAGLSDDFKASIRDDDAGAWVVGLNRSAYETFMTQSENRDLRKRLFDGYRLRASTGDYDNGPILIQVAQLRARRAELMGYESHAHYQLETRMARTPRGAEEFLLRVWRPGLERAREELADMQAIIGDEFTMDGHDWWHYAEKVREARYNFDDNALKPYFELNAVRGGAFELANRLFGLSFEAVDVPVWNSTVTAFDVSDDDGSHLGLLMVDVYARESKRGGAWMNNYREASNINGAEIRPLVTMNLNLPQPPAGNPTLMRFSDVETFFHEFGHGLHGLMTKISYPAFSGVSGPRDFTEFPAQILEHWPGEPVMLELYAKHYVNNDVIPQDLIEKMRAAANFNQGFATTEYIAASLLDLRWHSLTSAEAATITDAAEFENRVLGEYGLIDEIEPRYRSQYFNHIFASGYSAGYYAYLWSEILDADGFDAFKQSENLFDPETAARLKQWIYQSGGLREADELYRNFRGGDPNIEPLLRGRGFAVEEDSDD